MSFFDNLQTLLPSINLEEYQDNIDILEFDDTHFRISEKSSNNQYTVYINNNKDINSKKFSVVSLNFYEDFGLFYKNYCEFLIDKDGSAIDNQEFMIGNLKVTIDEHPSLLFLIAHYDLLGDKFFRSNIEDGGISLLSIKGDNLTLQNLEQNLSKVQFILGYYDEAFNKHYPQYNRWEDVYDTSNGLSTDVFELRRENNIHTIDGCFPDFKYPEAIQYYNAGLSLKGNQLAFQYFYKILEYFWGVLNEKPKETKYIKEREQLQILIRSIKSEITHLISSAINKGHIKKEDNYDKAIILFSNKLYNYRCDIVHAKSDAKYTVELPYILDKAKGDFWINVTRQLAEILIETHCIVK